MFHTCMFSEAMQSHHGHDCCKEKQLTKTFLSTLADQVYEAVAYLRQSKVLEEGIDRGGKGKEKGQERRMKKLEGEAKRKAWEEG
jgi:hypothetical protein